eukprot:11644347-Prorocentrum_lima.AAC.1
MSELLSGETAAASAVESTQAGAEAGAPAGDGQTPGSLERPAEDLAWGSWRGDWSTPGWDGYSWWRTNDWWSAGKQSGAWEQAGVGETPADTLRLL